MRRSEVLQQLKRRADDWLAICQLPLLAESLEVNIAVCEAKEEGGLPLFRNSEVVALFCESEPAQPQFVRLLYRNGAINIDILAAGTYTVRDASDSDNCTYCHFDNLSIADSLSLCYSSSSNSSRSSRAATAAAGEAATTAAGEATAAATQQPHTASG